MKIVIVKEKYKFTRSDIAGKLTLASQCELFVSVKVNFRRTAESRSNIFWTIVNDDPLNFWLG